MTLFESLLMAHLVGDWLVQTEWQALNKVRNWRAMLAHVAVYHLLVLSVLLFRFGWGDARVYLAVGVLALSHGILDRRTPLLWLMRILHLIQERQPERWLAMAVDQVIHIVLLGAATLFLTQ